MTFAEALIASTEEFCSLTPDQLRLLEKHYEMLVRWNPRLNLTTVLDPVGAARKHYAESLFLGSILPSSVVSVADIGSGAGFPGFPIAVLRPELRVTLVEADIRKSVFLQECRDFLPALRVVNQRADRVPTQFDALVTRAVNLDEIARLLPARASIAFALASCSGSTWNVVQRLPWNAESCVVSRGTIAE